MLGDDVEEEDGSSGGFSSRRIISLVRNYWGCEDYVPPVDRAQLKHAAPGHRYEWKEDNQSSFLALVGLYTPKEVSDTSNTPAEDEVPMSLANEPPSNVRNDQNILSQYLSTKTNPTGVKTRLSLLPFSTMDEGANVDTDGDAGYETECTFPANTSTNTLRELCQGSDAQGLKRDLAEGDPAFRSKSIDETIRTKSWNEDCRWVVNFSDSDDGSVGGTANDFAPIDGGLSDSFGGNTASEEASKELLHNTSIHSSWSYFADLASTAATSPLGSRSVTTSATAGSSTASATVSADPLQAQKLQHQIATLEEELKDSSSLRDRDGMYEELRLAKRELRGLKPLWKRFW